MQKICTQCEGNFEITEEDFKFYEDVSPVIAGKKYLIPSPTFCPDCRQQRRISFRNEYTLYRRICDGTGENILSVFSPDKPFKIYKNDYWYSDKWDPKDYGRDFDFKRPFFEQFRELMEAVPQLALSVTMNQNSDFVNQCGFCKDCYMIFEADGDEKCMYSNYISDCISSVDCLKVYKCELCYECMDCKNCYNVKYSQNCQNCSDSIFLKDCIGCKNCFGSVNLRNKEYYFFNEQFSKEEYFEKVKNLKLESYSNIKNIYDYFLKFTKQFPNKHFTGIQNQNSLGDFLNNTKNCYYCFDTDNAEDCNYVFYGKNLKKVYDMSVFGAEKGAEFCYEVHEIGDGVRNVSFGDQIWSGCYDILYSKLCLNGCNNLFGCVGMKKASYCIFNKQYNKEDYEILLVKIIEHMKTTNEWGEFFPSSISPFGYNETIAPRYFSMNKEEALSKKFRWSDYENESLKVEKIIPANAVPETINEIPDDILNWAIECEVTGEAFRIVKPELDFYRAMNLPIPRRHYDQRAKDRMASRNPRKIFDRDCMKCNVKIKSTYAPDRTEIVYCEKCYLESVF